MQKITLDHAILSKFSAIKECAEVCDETGRVLGYFSPAVDRSEYDNVEIPFTEEQLQQFEQEPGGRSLAEILADLEKRA